MTCQSLVTVHYGKDTEQISTIHEGVYAFESLYEGEQRFREHWNRIKEIDDATIHKEVVNRTVRFPSNIPGFMCNKKIKLCRYDDREDLTIVLYTVT